MFGDVKRVQTAAFALDFIIGRGIAAAVYPPGMPDLDISLGVATVATRQRGGPARTAGADLGEIFLFDTVRLGSVIRCGDDRSSGDLSHVRRGVSCAHAILALVPIRSQWSVQTNQRGLCLRGSRRLDPRRARG